MKLQSIFVAAISIILLSGCSATLPPVNFSVPNVGLSQRKIDADLKSITVTAGRPEELVGSIPANGTLEASQHWQIALTEAINKMAIFQDDAIKKVNLSVKVLEHHWSGLEGEMSVRTTARYEIMDRKTGDLILTQNISSSGTVPLDSAFMGIARIRESSNRAVQNNILQFLQALETVDVQKPMFPAKVGEIAK